MNGLTIRILGVNIIALMILGLGILYLGQYTDNLIRTELEALKSEARLFAGALSEGAVRPVFQIPLNPYEEPVETEAIKPELARKMVRTLSEIGKSQVKLYNVEGSVVADSHKLVGPGGVVMIEPLSHASQSLSVNALFNQSVARFLNLIPMQTSLPDFNEAALSDAFLFTDTSAALLGTVSATGWYRKDRAIVITAAAPIQSVKKVLGVVLLVRSGENLQKSIDEVRVDVFRVFLGALGITVMLSIYLSGLISRPLQKLAAAAEEVRMGKGRRVEIPDMSARRDEIGELSVVLRDMTNALWSRMGAIERFAADVSHEIKNPLTSLRSAVETAARVKDDTARQKLMDVILHDVQRLDRLISDISNASRLDAELGREEMEPVDMKTLLGQMIDIYRKPLKRVNRESTDDDTNIILDAPASETVLALGNANRLGQVFSNLISNALSFSPDNEPVHVRMEKAGDSIVVKVEDKGPGIPENKLEAIFERFYTERPAHEGYGSHSGLGLSISKQIVTAHGGQIWADNIKDQNGRVTGARFTVILSAA